MRLHLRGVPLTVPQGSIVTFKVALHNGTREDREVQTPTSKRFDLRVHDPTGAVVFDAHRDHLFLQVVTPLRVPAGKEVVLGEATHRLASDAAVGTYAVVAQCATLEGVLEERVTFDVTTGREPAP